MLLQVNSRPHGVSTRRGSSEGADTLCDMTTSRPRPKFTLIATVATLAITGFAAACGSGDPSGPESTAGEAPTQSPSASASATEPASDWKVAESSGAQFRTPPDWTVRVEDGVTQVMAAPKDDQGNEPGFGLFDAGSTLALSTDELATESRNNVIGDYSKIERLQDEKFGGTTFFHIRGTGENRTYDLYGALVGDIQVTVSWSFGVEMASRKQIDAWINQVMPTFQFEG